MSRLTQDGTAEPVSRDQIPREILIFLVQLTTCRMGNLTRLIHTLAICVTIHAYMSDPKNSATPRYYSVSKSRVGTGEKEC